MTINQAIMELILLSKNGHGEKDIIVMQYAGGDDEPCDIHFQLNDDSLMLETTYRKG